MGGFDARGRASAVAEAYDRTADAWEPLPDLPRAVHHPMAANLDGEVVVCGGFAQDGKAIAECWKLAGIIGAEEWTTLPPMPAPRGAGAMVALRQDDGDGVESGHELLVAGGIDGAGRLAESAFLFANGSWTEVAGLSTPREHLAAAFVRGHAYFAGGREYGWNDDLATVERFHRGNGTWEAVAPMLTARGGNAAAAVRGMLVVVGGEEAAGTFEEVEAFSPSTGAWTRLPDLPTARHGLGAAEGAGTLYVLIGGARPGLDTSGIVEAYG